VDILPTILELVALPVPQGLDGVSLVPVLRGEATPPLWAYGEAGRSFSAVDPEKYLQGNAGKRRMIRSADWKLVFIPKPGGGEQRLYDLRRDPGETRDVAAETPDTVWELRARLDEIFARELAGSSDRALEPAEIERLRALGYLK
jgi:arylsulfatase